MIRHAVIMKPEAAPQVAGDVIRVLLTECTAQLRVGCNESEKHGPQPVIVNIELEAALSERYDDLKETGLSRVIDYTYVYKFIQETLTRLDHVELLESVGEKIIEFCFEDRRIQKVRVRLEKPNFLEGTSRVGIEMYRTRPTA